MIKFNNEIFVTKSFLPPIEEYIKEIKPIWEKNWLTNNGSLHNEFEKKITNHLKVDYSTLFVNGHLALETAIKALNLEGEVITTPFTFASTTHAIVNCNLKPVFCDIEMDTFTIDTDKIEGLITERTSAIIPVHVFGNPCNVNAIEKIAQKYNLKVIYDAAHVFGVEVNGRGIGSFGDISMFSLHATKVFHSIEGGALTYSNAEHKKKFDLLKNFGITGPESVESVGINAKMNEFQAAMGLVNLKYVDAEIALRKRVADCYREHLQDIKGIKYLNDIDGVKHNYAYFPILVDKNRYGKTRDQLHEVLAKYNVFTRKYFFPLTADFTCYRNKFPSSVIPQARGVSDAILTIPIYSDIELDVVKLICEIIKSEQRKT